MRHHSAASAALLAILAVLSSADQVLADPCGMVPPIYVTDNTSIVRVGDEQTYVFYNEGIETFVIRPGFSGKVEDFGMLISFPTPPALRKVSEDIFPQIAKAIDPPEVVVDLRWRLERRSLLRALDANESKHSGASGLRLKTDEVRVLKEEAVGMYEVAVLEAGSAAALKRWMDDHGYKYPTGMDEVCEEYVKLGWCFVAEKAKVGGKANVDPKPRMKGVDTKLPSGSTFDGHVQAMAFRFKTDKLILPMRLSAFNEGTMHNIVYLLTDGPRKIRSIPEEYVVRQVNGADLFKNVTDPLPLRIIGGTEADIQDWQRQGLPQQRDPTPHNGFAKELFAGDLLAVKTGRLSHQFEEDEKMLLRIGEHFGLRGPEIDKLNLAALDKEREKAVKEALGDLKKMTMTVIDGDFPREVVGAQNLIFGDYRMPARRNSAEFYDAKNKMPAGKREGTLKLGVLEPASRRGNVSRLAFITTGTVFVMGLVVLGLWRRRTVGCGSSLDGWPPVDSSHE
jgi:hypothetical protein